MVPSHNGYNDAERLSNQAETNISFHRFIHMLSYRCVYLLLKNDHL